MNRALIAILILGGFGALLAWQSQRSGVAAVSVHVAQVERGALADTVLASGNLVYENQVDLRSEVTGRVAEVRVEEGDRVQRDDVLMRLDPEAFQADVERASAGVRAAEIEIQRLQALLANLDRQVVRQRSLHQSGLVGEESWEQLLSQREVASISVRAGQQALLQQQAQLDIANDRLRRSVFRAPIDGLMISVDVQEGETVIAGTTNIMGSDLMTLADTSAILAELRVDEADIARVSLGQQVELFAAAWPQSALQGKVTHIGSSARQLGSAPGLAFRVRALLDAGDRSLHPGMSCRAEIITTRDEPSLNVPVAAVRSDDEGSFVWRIGDDDRVERVAVTLGMATDLNQAVLSGLQFDDSVVIGPGRTLSQLTAGTRVSYDGEAP